MSRKCMFTGTRPNVAHAVSHSNIKTKKRQLPNLHAKRFFWSEGNTYVALRLSARAIRTISKKGLQVFAEEVGLRLADH